VRIFGDGRLELALFVPQVVHLVEVVVVFNLNSLLVQLALLFIFCSEGPNSGLSKADIMAFHRVVISARDPSSSL